MAETDNLNSSVPQPAGNWIAGIGNEPNVPSNLGGAVGAPPDVEGGPTANAPAALPIQPGQPDLPRFQRTFGNTLKGIAIGLMMNGIPGGIVGGINPRGIQRQAAANAQLAQAKITFQNAQAAHEVAMAHQADLEYQALPEKLQQESEARGLANMEAAKKAGYLPVASVPLDQGEAQNSQNASTALNQVKSQFGAVPSGLLYIHTGSGMTVMKLQDPNAALPLVNQARKAQGMPELTTEQFASLNPQDRDGMARNALNFTNPRDVNGLVTQNSLNEAQMRLSTVKAQPDFTGKDALVTQLQESVDHQKAVLDSGASQEAIRKGQAQGSEAQAAQPGTTAAKVAEQTGLSKTPQGQAQLAEAQARTRQANAEADKALSEAGLGGLKPADPVIGYDTNGDSILTNAANAKQLGLHDTMKPDAAFVEKVSIARSYIPLNNQLLADIDQLQKSGKLGAAASRWNEFMTGKVGAGDPDFEKFRVDLGLANTALMQFHVGNRGSSAMLEHFQNLADGRKMDANTLRAGVEAEGDYAAHRAMMPSALAQQISGTKLRQSSAPQYGIQKSTGKPVVSLDGGKTWQLRQ